MVYTSRKRKAPYGRRYLGGTRYPKRRRTVISRGLAPPRTGGYYGPASRSLMEAKAIDVDVGNLTINSTGTITLLNGCATGTDFTDRIGRKIMMKSVYLRGFIQPEDSLVNSSSVRVMLVYDTQTNGVAPSITDILKSANPMSQLNLNNRDRFKVCMDKIFTMAALTAVFIGTPTAHSFKKYKKLRYDVQYGGTTNAIGSIATGALFLVTISDQPSGNGSLFTVSTRVRFLDA